jgi:DNA-binding XRE family transcriptional regulator
MNSHNKKKRPIVVNSSLIASMERGKSQPNLSGCIEWQGATVDGYGVLCQKVGESKWNVLAHRAAWVIANGQEIPHNMVIAHKCDNRLCVNPDHLECVGQSKNVKDACLRGRLNHFRGERSWNAVLSEKTVRNLRVLHNELGISVSWLAWQIGVSHETASRAIRGKTWRHVV